MMCTVKHSIYFFGLILPLLHRLQSICLDHLFFLMGCLYNLLASVSVHAWVACLPSCFFFSFVFLVGFLEARDLLFGSCYMTNIHSTLKQAWLPLMPPLIPPPSSPCRLSLSFIQSHPSGFHLVLLFGRVVALKDTRKLFISCSPSPCLGLSFIFSSYPQLFLDAVRFSKECSLHNKPWASHTLERCGFHPFIVHSFHVFMSQNVESWKLYGANAVCSALDKAW